METIHLPSAIEKYFAADSGAAPDVSDVFAEDATVTDEGRTYRGRREIARWKAETSTKYQYTCQPFRVEELGGRIVVTAHLVGNFPGSPIDLRYSFKLENGKISALEIFP